MYQKEIIYIGLYKDGNRIGNAGFLKVENREEESRLGLQLKNIPSNIRGRFPFRIYNGNIWKEINGVSVQEGGGSWEENVPDMAQKVQIQITLPGGYFLEGKSKNARSVSAQEKPEAEGGIRLDLEKEEKQDGFVETRQEIQQRNQRKVQQKDQQKNRPADDELSGRPEEMQDRIWHHISNDTEPKVHDDILENSTKQMRNSVQDNAEIIPLYSVREKGTESEFRNKLQSESERKRQDAETIIVTEELQNPDKGKTAGSGRFVPELSIPEPPAAYSLKEDKWEQILDSYEQIHPYGDERVYVRLEPKDFIILQSRYQHLVNNSFLLHGFYNYRYVILGKENDYYLGVPGVFYEREKMVALMFGFEAFECPGGIARAGEFGYYLRKVEI